jgi:exopolyphosphatase / guanosine-5'-triphosphate,3'-diphosphate pyrophosphatase
LRRACIDIGSNTTRLLVADCAPGVVIPVHQERAFTHVGRGRLADGTIAAEKIAEVVAAVGEQLRIAAELGAGDVHAVATAAIRLSANGPELALAVHRACGVEVQILTWEEEARLAFVGAARTFDGVADGELGVVDVGGGSSELVVGRPPDEISWSASFALGSGELARAHLRSDPPSAAELATAAAEVRQTLGDADAPQPAHAVAVGSSATSLSLMAGPTLDAAAFTRSLATLAAAPADEISDRFSIDRERVRLLPAGLLILQAVAELLGAPLTVAAGGLREGVLLEASRG